MDFLEVLDQVIELIRTRGRITYRALSLHFRLDDETLDGLKDELLFTYPVVDEEGRGLVWTGEPPESHPNAQSETEKEILLTITCGGRDHGLRMLTPL